MFESGNSKLIELPELLGSSQRISRTEIVNARSAEELLRQAHVDASVAERALYRGDTFAHYRILGFIAAGGMGEIYAAERLDDDGARRRPVALKVVNPSHGDSAEIMELLEREAEICRAIHSRHTIRIYEYGYDSVGRCYLAMELLDGEELFDRMRAHKVFPLMELAELAVQVLRGLYSVHRAGVVHRDLKPENIFLVKDERGKTLVKLLDFGIASFGSDEEDPLQKKPGQIFGTPQYLAPEQCRSPRVDLRADLYSLGVILYECAAGNPPFDLQTPYATMLAHQEEKLPPLPSTLDPEFCEIIYKSLTKTPEKRWQSADEMRFVLERWIEETSWVDDAMHGSDGVSLGIGGGVSFEDLMQGSAPPATPFLGSAVATTSEHDGLFADLGYQEGRVPDSASRPSSQPRRSQASAQLLKETGAHAPRVTPNRPRRAVTPSRSTPQEGLARMGSSSNSYEDLELMDVRPRHPIRPAVTAHGNTRPQSHTKSKPAGSSNLITIVAIVAILGSLGFFIFSSVRENNAMPSTEDAILTAPEDP